MSLAVTEKDAQEIRRLIPLNILSTDRFEALCSDLQIEEAARGGLLFNQGDAKNEFVYVLSGIVSLQAGGMEMEVVRGGTEAARFALAHQLPRKVSAIAKDRVHFIRVDTAYVNQPADRPSGGGVATYEVSDLPDEAAEDWMTTLLKSPIFQRLPPANLQNMLGLLEEVPVEAGQEIIHQDEPGDYYYVIKRGRCALTRKPSPNAKEIKLGELKTSDTFGEDALISEQPRNVTVSMMTEGVLLRLGKADFLKLVKDPVIAYVNWANAQALLQQGAKCIDVRTLDQFERFHIPDAFNIPFFRLRMELASLDRRRKYILVCENGRISEAAAFQLLRFSFEAYVLKGGMESVPREQLAMADQDVVISMPEVREAALPKPVAQTAPSPKPEEKLAPTEQERAPISRAAPQSLAEQQMARARELLEALRKENLALKTEVSGVRADMAKLQARLKEMQSRESELRERLRHSEEEGEEARERVRALTAQLAGQEGSAEKKAGRMDIEAFEEQARRLRELEIAHEMVKSDLQHSLEENESLEKEVKDLMELRAGMETEENAAPPPEEPARAKKMRQLEADKATLEEELRIAARQVEELEKHAGQLSSLLQEFVEKQQSEENDFDEAKALRTELEMVHSQANADVMAMQTRLRAAEQESAKLRQELEKALAKAGERHASERDPGLGPSIAKPAPARAKAWIYIASLAAAAALAYILTATEFGQAWLQTLLEFLP
jgi:CRP-like cAMP-binding protein